MIADQVDEIKKYLARHPDRSVEYTRIWKGLARLEVVFPDGKRVIVEPNSMFPE